MDANVGSAATIPGNPLNRMIGGFAGIPYGVLGWVERDEFAGAPRCDLRRERFVLFAGVFPPGMARLTPPRAAELLRSMSATLIVADRVGVPESAVAVAGGTVWLLWLRRSGSGAPAQTRNRAKLK